MSGITLSELLKKMIELGGSDLHITTNSPPRVRVHGKLRPMDMAPLTAADTKALAYSVSAFFPAVAGGLYFFKSGIIEPNSAFDLTLSIEAIVMIMLGGYGTVTGPTSRTASAPPKTPGCATCRARTSCATRPGCSSC